MELTRLPVERLTADDDLFIRMDLVLGLPVVNQFIWRLPGCVEPNVLRTLAARLKRGPLSRLVVRRRSPCRDMWFYTEAAGSFDLSDAPVEPGQTHVWARRQAQTDLDIVHGPAWRLSAAYAVDGNTTNVSLVSSHAIGDGGAIIEAVRYAIHDTPFDRSPIAAGAMADLRDGLGTLVSAATATARLLKSSSRSSAPRGATFTAEPPIPDNHNIATAEPSATATVWIPAAKFERIAEAAGGTVNSLFVAIMVGLIERSGRAADGDVIPLNLPMSLRGSGDRRANATTATTAHIPLDKSRYESLSAVRSACKDAFNQSAQVDGRVAHLSVIGQSLGDSLFRRLAANATTPLCLASNLGELPDDFASLGTGSPAPLTARAITTTTPERLADRKGGLSGWLSVAAGMVAISVTALDPVHVHDSTALAAMLDAELDTWSIPRSDWDT